MGSAQTRANNKYQSKKYDRVTIVVPKGRKAELQAAAQEQGESLNGFISKAIEERTERISEGGA